MSKFVYLLNSMEAAGQSENPSDERYGDKRSAVLAYVHRLEEDAARYEWLRSHGAALAGSYHQREGLVRRFGNLDEEIDKARSAAVGSIKE